jgi:tRNA threonylcarbamoyl adenosine modification protein (Sua5/YciO/YrdC/YwlC family)
MRLAKAALGRKELAVVPTDTVYGLACDAFSHEGVAKLLSAKGRDRQAPPPVLIGNAAALEGLAQEVPQLARKLAETFWPGALTMILKSQPSLTWDLGETKGTVALRMPDHKIALALLQETGPLAVSSANLTGEPAAITCQQAEIALGSKVKVYLDGGASPKGEASTIVDMTGLVDSVSDSGELVTTGKARIVRRGALSQQKLASVLGEFLEG